MWVDVQKRSLLPDVVGRYTVGMREAVRAGGGARETELCRVMLVEAWVDPLYCTTIA